MTEISDLIKFENENSSLDFKAIQYKKEMYESFLKDIMSLANSMSKDDKYIIIGVKHKTNGDRDLLGITETFVDDATYQQIVDSNIEPHINFSYFSYEYEGKLFGIFQIKECTNPPYMMKKDFGNLRQGDSFIRKGSFQKRLTRKDIDNHQNIIRSKDISKDVFISFSQDEIIHELILEKIELMLSSEYNRKTIEEVINQKEQELKDNPYPFKNLFPSHHTNMYNSSYENRDLPTLRSNLENVSRTYQEHDEYYINEKTAHKLNIYLHNNSNEFLEDASVEILIPYSENYEIRESIYREPYSTHALINVTPKAASWEELDYPSVEKKHSTYRIYEEIGSVKHKLPIEALKVPLRIVIKEETVGLEIEINVKIYAKNIENPIQQNLKIKI